MANLRDTVHRSLPSLIRAPGPRAPLAVRPHRSCSRRDRVVAKGVAQTLPVRRTEAVARTGWRRSMRAVEALLRWLQHALQPTPMSLRQADLVSDCARAIYE